MGDQPQHEVFGGNGQSYRYMAYPPQKQILQLLYPGRPMLQNYGFLDINIPNEDPFGLEETKYQSAALTHAAKMEQEALARHLGGKDKVVRHPAVDPDEMINNPQLQWLPGSDIDVNLDRVPSKFDSLSGIVRDDESIVDQVRGGMRNESPNPLSREDVLPRYDWQASGVGYDGIEDNIIETFAMDYKKPMLSQKKEVDNNTPFVVKFSVAISLFVFFSFIILLSYGIYKAVE